MKKIGLLLLTIVLTFSCKKDDDSSGASIENKEASKLNLVTGILLRAGAYDQPIVYGNPNGKGILQEQTSASNPEPGNGGLTTSELPEPLVVFPNPPVDFLWIKTNFEKKASKIWIVNGVPTKKYASIDYKALLQDVSYSDGELENASLISLSDANIDSPINISDLEVGYYRIFVKSEVGLEWANFYKPDNSANAEDLFSIMDRFWN